MNTRQRLTVIVSLVAALMLTPAVAIAQDTPTLADLKVMAPDAATKYAQAQTRLQETDARLAETRARFDKVKAELPSTPAEEVRAAAAAVVGTFSPAVAKRVDRTADNVRLRDELRVEIEQLETERESVAAEAEEARKQAELWQSELDKAQTVANAEVAETLRAQHASAIRLMIDPGHGGHDPGAVGNGLMEKDVVMSISYKVVAAAQRQGWNVALTRDGDYFVPLPQRPAAARAWGATAFVSIHSNSAGAAPRGNMTIYRTADGAVLGQKIMQQLDPLTGYGDWGNLADSRGLAVLRGASMSATLVEVLAVSSPAEVMDLANPEAQAAYAEAIVRGVADFHGIAYVPPVQPAAPAEPAPVVNTEPVPAPVEEAPSTKPAENREEKKNPFEEFMLFLSR